MSDPPLMHVGADQLVQSRPNDSPSLHAPPIPFPMQIPHIIVSPCDCVMRAQISDQFGRDRPRFLLIAMVRHDLGRWLLSGAAITRLTSRRSERRGVRVCAGDVSQSAAVELSSRHDQSSGGSSSGQKSTSSVVTSACRFRSHRGRTGTSPSNPIRIAAPGVSPPGTLPEARGRCVACRRSRARDLPSGSRSEYDARAERRQWRSDRRGSWARAQVRSAHPGDTEQDLEPAIAPIGIRMIAPTTWRLSCFIAMSRPPISSMCGRTTAPVRRYRSG